MAASAGNIIRHYKMRPTIQNKCRLIEEYEKSGLSKSAFAKKHMIPRTSLIGILMSKEKLYDSLLTLNGTKRKRLRKSNFENIETALLKWVYEAKAKNLPMSGNILKEKALEFAKEFDNHEFTASNGWLVRFKERHGLSFKKISDESVNLWLQNVTFDPSDELSDTIGNDSTPTMGISFEEWESSILKYILDNYQPSNIYSLHETQLLYRLLPDRSPEQKNNNDQLGILLGVNVIGSDKLKPIVIGKSVTPKCFKNINILSLPVTYKSNPNASVSLELWFEVIKELDNKFKSDDKKVAVIVNNFSLANIKGLKAIELICIPPNVASIHQSKLYKEIILNFKNNYRKFLLRDWINTIDNNCTFNPTILDSIDYIFKSWRNVSARIIQNCFKNVGFLNENYVPDLDGQTDMEQNISLTHLFEELKNRGKVLQMDKNIYLNIDISNSNQKTLNASKDIKEFEYKSNDETSESDSEEVCAEPPSKKHALESFNIIKKYLLSIKGTTFKDHESLYQIEHKIMNSGCDYNLNATCESDSMSISENNLE